MDYDNQETADAVAELARLSDDELEVAIGDIFDRGWSAVERFQHLAAHPPWIIGQLAELALVRGLIDSDRCHELMEV